MTRFRPLAGALAALLAAGLLAACGSDDSSDTGTAASTDGIIQVDKVDQPGTNPADTCTKDQLQTRSSGTLTIGTDKPAYPPYFENDDPTNGKGFESAVAYAIADKLGFTKDEVKWTVVPFNSSYAPGNKDFDFDVNQISITPKRAERVDFSDPYYTAPQAVVALKDAAAANATSLADLKDTQLGVQIGTTSLDAVEASIKPSKQTKVFNDSNDTVAALKQGQVDAIVVDLPTALYLTAAEIPKAKVVGQFEAPGGDKWGAVLSKDSPLTDCVNKAIGELQSSGELDQLTQKWMSDSAGAPELQ
jgi:polar amino acid transport system substrate-binding protein